MPKPRVRWYAAHHNNQNHLYYGTWSQVSPQILGRSGVKHKGFDDKNSAENWLKSLISSPVSNISTEPTRSYDQIAIYTDGSYLGGRKKGGWAYVVTDQSERIISQRNGQLDIDVNIINTRATNNRAELTAILKALEETNYPSVTIYSDSQYSIKSVTTWAQKWQKNGWISSQGIAVKNKDLISQILHLQKLRSVTFQHIPAHQGYIFNELADKLAKEAARLY